MAEFDPQRRNSAYFPKRIYLLSPSVSVIEVYNLWLLELRHEAYHQFCFEGITNYTLQLLLSPPHNPT